MSETTTPPTAEPEHPEWCDRESCNVHYEPTHEPSGDGWIGFHQTRTTELDFGEHGGVWLEVQQFRSGDEAGGAMEPPRLFVDLGHYTRPNAEQAAELVRVLTEHAEMLARITDPA